MPMENRSGSNFWISVLETSTYSICGINERIVDSNNADVIVLNGISEDNTANTTKAIDADFYWCHNAKVVSADDSKSTI